MGRREEKRELVRRQLLMAAAQLFAEKGYESTSIEDVTDRANFSKGTFYYHFQSKDELVIELRRWFLAGTMDQTLAMIEQGKPPLMVLEKLLLDRAAFTEK